jgi:hypothetical protein
MGKASPNTTLDPNLEKIATATRLTVLTDQPADFAGIAALLLAEAVVTPGDGNGDFTIADGDVSGRKVGVGAQNDLAIDATGDADHIALDDGSILLYVTTCTLQGLTSGGTVSVPGWGVEIADPS